VIRRFLVLGTLLAVSTGPLLAPTATLSAGPTRGRAPLTEVPPLRTDGPIVLPDGRVLPVEPAWVSESSVQAEMLAAHAGDRIHFVPGELPQRRGAPNATLGLSSGATDQITTLGLAPATGATATLATAAALPNGLRKEVFGFLPYWMLDAGSLQWMQYQLVTTIAYFGVAAQSDGTLATTSGGSPTAGWSGWNSSAMTGVINAAHARGVRVVLTITMMAWDGGAGQAALLGSDTARALLVGGIVAAVRDRAADGVNLDFEPVFTPQRDQYTSFVTQLKAALVAAGVGSYLTVDTSAGAATWATGYDLAGLIASGVADAVFVMGYDYSWSGSARAGGVAPMDSPYILDVGDSVDDYLATIPGAKIIWGVPYYGRTWQTTSGDPNSPTRSGASGASKAYSYTGARNLAATNGRRWDSVGMVPWFAYYDTANATWLEGYYDDAQSLAAKYDMVNQKELAGTGMWTLLMDQGDNALWSLLANKFVNDTSPPIGGIRTLPAKSDEVAARVEWAATDVGSGVQSYSVQVRDLATATWTAWLTGTTATAAYYEGVSGHSYEFRVSAVDYDGNAQPWLPASPAPGTALALGGFAQVTVDTLNVRSGVGSGFSRLDQLSNGSLVAVLAGPIAAGGYQWYQVQFDFSEWPSADYPRLGWVAAGTAQAAYLTPTKAPNVTTLTNGYHLPVTGATYVALTPARLLDSRVGNGLSGTFSAGVPRTFQVTGRGGVPSNAVAVTGNLTVTNQTTVGAVYLGPNPTSSPSTSTLNFPVGDNRANAVSLALGAGGTLSATYLAVSGSTDLVFDVTGYFAPDLTGATYVALTPARLLDSRVGNGLSGTFSAGVPRTFQVTGRGGVPSNAVAVTGNLTVTNQTTVGAVYLGPNPTSSPSTSTLNFPVGDNRANAVSLALGAGGTLSATYLAVSGSTDLVFDVTGYFAQ
jgi:spore germination protein YaaH